MCDTGWRDVFNYLVRPTVSDPEIKQKACFMSVGSRDLCEKLGSRYIHPTERHRYRWSHPNWFPDKHPASAPRLECTFKPAISMKSKTLTHRSYIHLYNDKDRRKKHIETLREKKRKLEEKDLTFKPDISQTARALKGSLVRKFMDGKVSELIDHAKSIFCKCTISWMELMAEHYSFYFLRKIPERETRTENARRRREAAILKEEMSECTHRPQIKEYMAGAAKKSIQTFHMFNELKAAKKRALNAVAGKSPEGKKLFVYLNS